MFHGRIYNIFSDRCARYKRRDNVARFATCVTRAAQSGGNPRPEIYARRMVRVVVAIVRALGNSVGASSSPI